MKKIVVLYHKNCIDGFAGAWAVWKKFGSKADYIPVRPESLPEKPLYNKEIFAIDVSYPKLVQEKLRRDNKLVILDHHISRKKDTEISKENIFNNDRSGATLAWNYFHSKKKLPRLLKYVEENDLWHFNSPHSKEIGAALTLIDLDFKTWNSFSKKFENLKFFKKLVLQGSTILSYEKQAIKFIMRRSVSLVKFEGYKVFAANSPVVESDLGHVLARKRPPLGVVWRLESDGYVGVSLRSNGKIDVSKIAKKYNGGGHKRAAGFGFPLKKGFPWKFLNEK